MCKPLPILITLPLFKAAAADFHVFAAAGLTHALKEIAEGLEHANLNFGDSSLPVRQIEKGASTAVFASADEAKMDQLPKNGLVVAGTDSVRAADAAGNADFDFGYETEADISKRVRGIEPSERTWVPYGFVVQC